METPPAEDVVVDATVDVAATVDAAVEDACWADVVPVVVVSAVLTQTS